jgi:hypothetical protein
MAKTLSLAIALAALSCACLADVGPGPDPATLPYVVIDATFDGWPVPDETVAVAHCFVDGEENFVPTTTLSCSGGVCKNSGWYKLSPCVDSQNASAVFEFTIPLADRTINTSALPIRGGKTYRYAVAMTNDGRAEADFESVSDNAPSLCPLSLAILALAGLGIAAKRCE